MDVGMVLHLPPPSVKHAEKTGEIGAHVFFIRGQFFQGIGGCPEQGVVRYTLVTSHEKPELLGNGEGD